MNEARPEAEATWWSRPDRLVLLACGVLALAALALWPWWRAGREEADSTNVPAGVSVQAVARRDFSEFFPWLGRVEGTRSVSVVALEAGRVEAVAARDGDRVEKGTVLFRFGGPELEPRLVAARSEVSELKTRLALAEGVVARREEAVRDRIADENALAAAKGEEAALRAELAQARGRLELFQAQSELRAPVSGVFTDRTVNPGQDVAPGTVLAEVVDPSGLRVAATVYGTAGASLEGLEASVEEAGKAVEAAVSHVFPDRSPAGGSRIWIEGPALARSLHPGAFVSGTVRFSSRSQVLAVPREAVVYDDHEHPYVFLEKGGAFVQTPVRLGLSEASWVEVDSGLKEGDRVAVRGAYELYYRDFGKTYQVED